MASLGAVVPFLSAPVALAHASDARLELSAQRVPPGVTVSLRGVGFGMDEEVTLELVGPGGVAGLGTAAADAYGVFEVPILIPVEASQGEHSVMVTGADGHPVVAILVVEGPAFVPDDHDHGEDVVVPVTIPPDGGAGLGEPSSSPDHARPTDSAGVHATADPVSAGGVPPSEPSAPAAVAGTAAPSVGLVVGVVGALATVALARRRAPGVRGQAGPSDRPQQ